MMKLSGDKEGGWLALQLVSGINRAQNLILVAKIVVLLVTFEVGYALWRTGILLCSQSRNVKAEISLP